MTITANYISHYLPILDLILTGTDPDNTSTTTYLWSSDPPLPLADNNSTRLVITSHDFPSDIYTIDFTLTAINAQGLFVGNASHRVVAPCLKRGIFWSHIPNGDPLWTIFDLSFFNDNPNNKSVIRYAVDFVYGSQEEVFFLGELSTYERSGHIYVRLPPVSPDVGLFRLRVYREWAYPIIYTERVMIQYDRYDLKAIFDHLSGHIDASLFNLTTMVHILHLSRRSFNAEELSSRIELAYLALPCPLHLSLHNVETVANALITLSKTTPPTKGQREQISQFLRQSIQLASTYDLDEGIITRLLSLVVRQTKFRGAGGKRDDVDLAADDVYQMVASLADNTFRNRSCQGDTVSYLADDISVLSMASFAGKCSHRHNISLFTDRFHLASENDSMTLESLVHHNPCGNVALIRWSQDARTELNQTIYTVYSPHAISGTVHIYVRDISTKHSCGFRAMGSEGWNTTHCHMTSDGIVTTIESPTEFTFFDTYTRTSSSTQSHDTTTAVSTSQTEMSTTSDLPETIESSFEETTTTASFVETSSGDDGRMGGL